MTDQFRTAFHGLSGVFVFGPWKRKYCKYWNLDKDYDNSIKQYNNPLTKHSMKHKMSENKERKFVDFIQKKCYHRRWIKGLRN